MKKVLLVLFVIAAASYAYALPAVSEKVLKVFTSAFPDVKHATWSQFENFYEACFESGDVKCRVKYNADGKVVSTIRYYGEKMVSPFLKAKLEERFPGKTIFGVTEVNSEDGLIYNVVLEDSKGWTHVQADGTGQAEVTKRFKKADQ